MSAAMGIALAVKGSLALTVFSIGLHSTPSDTTYLLRHRALLARSIAAMNVIMPAFALCVAIALHLLPAVTIALVALAMSPVPPFLPNKATKPTKAGGKGSYELGLLFAESVLSIAFVPATVWLLVAQFGFPFHVSLTIVARAVGTSVLIPLALGSLSRRIAPEAAARAARPTAVIATIALVATMIPILVTSWPAVRSLVANGTLAAIAAMTGLGLVIGHALGGPVRDDRTVLALATSSRHPGMAIAIASAAFPGATVVAVAVLMALLVGAIASAPYVTWSTRVFHADRLARAKARRPTRVTTQEGARRIQLGRAPERRK